MNCRFCNLYDEKYISENDSAFAVYDHHPMNKGHAIIICKRHIQSYFEATDEEVKEMHQLIQQTKRIIDEKFNPDGYNIAINIGKSAGQTVMHLHIHVIPRYTGDVENPKGGLRKLKGPREKKQAV